MKDFSVPPEKTEALEDDALTRVSGGIVKVGADQEERRNMIRSGKCPYCGIKTVMGGGAVYYCICCQRTYQLLSEKDTKKKKH